MKVKLKRNTYYKRKYTHFTYYDYDYSIYYVSTKWVYEIAYKRKGTYTIEKNIKPIKYMTVEHLEHLMLKGYLRDINYKNIEELSKADVFLELL